MPHNKKKDLGVYHAKAWQFVCLRFALYLSFAILVFKCSIPLFSTKIEKGLHGTAALRVKKHPVCVSDSNYVPNQVI